MKQQLQSKPSVLVVDKAPGAMPLIHSMEQTLDADYAYIEPASAINVADRRYLCIVVSGERGKDRAMKSAKTIARLRRLCRSTPLVIVSGFPDVRKAAVVAGADYAVNRLAMGKDFPRVFNVVNQPR